MTEEGSKMELVGSFLKMFDKNGTLLMKIKRSHNRLYRILLETSQPISLLTNFQTLKMMGEKKMATGLLKIMHPNQLCESCLVSKQARLSFPTQTSFRAEWPLQLVHVDCVARSPHHRLLVISIFSYLLTIIVVGCRCTCSKKKEMHYVHSRNSKDSLKTDLITCWKPCVPIEMASSCEGLLAIYLGLI